MFSASWDGRVIIVKAQTNAPQTVALYFNGQTYPMLKAIGPGYSEFSIPCDEKPTNMRLRSVKARAPLFVLRPVLNAAEILEWARRWGFSDTIEPDDMHATIAYSKTPFDWSQLKPYVFDLTVVGDEAHRQIIPLGQDGAVVLRFKSVALEARWRELRLCGASWDFEGYTPHLTLSWRQPFDARLAAHPWLGPIVFGPEQFRLLNENWTPPK